jgi:hypothetical protein
MLDSWQDVGKQHSADAKEKNLALVSEEWR